MSPSSDPLFDSIVIKGRNTVQLKPSGKDKPKNPHVRRILLAVGGVIICLLLCLLVSPVTRITPENCARIKPGMTQKQVEAILGGPPDWYDGMGGFQFDAASPTGKGADGLEWAASHGDVDVVFDGKGCVVKATFYPGHALGYDLRSFVVERLTRCTWSRWERWWTWG